MIVAQRALDTNQQPTYLSGQKSDKEKMLIGEFFKPYSKALSDDRDNCRTLLQPFNTNLGNNREERARLLRKVFESQGGTSRTGASNPTRVGSGVFVDSPFTCDYGYNIIIGNDVAIERECFISDPREVIIGANTMIGPGVKIMGKQFPYNPFERNGALHGKARGFKIRIGEGVCIGANCVIAPSEDWCKNGELIIGNGACILAGTTVMKVSACLQPPQSASRLILP